MTKPTIRGELQLHADGDTYRLVFDVNTFCTLEEHLKRPAMEAIVELQEAPTLTMLRAVIWAALQEHHEGLDLKDAGRIIGNAGMDNLTVQVMQTLNASLPSADEVASGAKGPRAAKAKPKRRPTAAGTGSNSTTSG
jgi:hypothetical protein